MRGLMEIAQYQAEGNNGALSNGVTARIVQRGAKIPCTWYAEYQRYPQGRIAVWSMCKMININHDIQKKD